MKPVFVSYSRRSNQNNADNLVNWLESAGVECFIDVRDIRIGDPFPPEIVDALLSTKVVVVFLDMLYTTRPYCLFELAVATSPHRFSIAVDDEPSLRGMVVAITEDETAATERLPTHLKQINWPKNVATEEIGQLVLRELDRNEAKSIAERLRNVAIDVDAFRSGLLSATKIRPTKSLAHVPHNGPIPSSIGNGYTGRELEMWQLDTALSSTFTTDQPQAQTLIVQGGPGYGKTRLVAEYVNRYAMDRFPQGIFWIGGDSDVHTLRSRQYDILRTLGRPEHPIQWYSDENNGSELARELTEAIRAVDRPEQILVIIDNYPEPIGTAPPISIDSINPLASLTTTLITSRMRIGDGLRHPILSLPVLDSDSARLLLRYGLVGQSLSNDEWNDIAQWVGNLPLALTLLNALVVSRALSPKQLRDLAEANRHTTQTLDEGAAALRGIVPTGSVVGVTTTLHLAISKLPATVQRAVMHIAQLASEVVPVAVLDRLPDVFTSEAKATLVNRSLVDPSVSDDGFGTMHRVISDFLRSRTNNIWFVREQMELAVSREAHEAMRVSNFSALVVLLPHMLDLWRVAVASDEAAAQGIVLRLSTLLVPFYITYDAPRRAVEVAQRMREYVTRVSNIRKEVIDQASSLLAAASATFGSYDDAERIALAELQSILQEVKPDSEREVQLRKTLATIYTETKQYGKAIEQWTRVVEYHREVFGADDELTLNEEVHLLMVMKWVDPVETAERFESLARKASEAGSDNFRLQRHILHNFGIVLGEGGQFARSLDNLQSALQIAETYLPNEKFRIAHIKLDLAMSTMEVRSPEDALPIAKEAYESLCELVAPENSHRTQAGSNLAMLYFATGDSESANAVLASLARGPYLPK